MDSVDSSNTAFLYTKWTQPQGLQAIDNKPLSGHADNPKKDGTG